MRTTISLLLLIMITNLWAQNIEPIGSHQDMSRSFFSVLSESFSLLPSNGNKFDNCESLKVEDSNKKDIDFHKYFSDNKLLKINITGNDHFSDNFDLLITSSFKNFYTSILVDRREHGEIEKIPNYMLISHDSIDFLLLVKVKGLYSYSYDENEKKMYQKRTNIEIDNVKEVYILDKKFKLLRSVKCQFGMIIGFSQFSYVENKTIETFYPVSATACKNSGELEKYNIEKIISSLSMGYSCIKDFKIEQESYGVKDVWLR